MTFQEASREPCCHWGKTQWLEREREREMDEWVTALMVKTLDCVIVSFCHHMCCVIRDAVAARLRWHNTQFVALSVSKSADIDSVTGVTATLADSRCNELLLQELDMSRQLLPITQYNAFFCQQIQLLHTHALDRRFVTNPASCCSATSLMWLELTVSDFSVGTWWRKVWVTNHSLIADSTACVPGFDLPWRLWVLSNGFRTGQGHCAANHHTWGWPTTRYAHVENYRWCPTLLMSDARRQSSRWSTGQAYTVLMTTLLSGWTVATYIKMKLEQYK